VADDVEQVRPDLVWLHARKAGQGAYQLRFRDRAVVVRTL